MNTETNFMSFENLTKLIEEHEKLKKQLDKAHDELYTLKNKYNIRLLNQISENIEPDFEDYYLAEIETKAHKYDLIQNQQKKFIEWLEDKIQQQETLMAENQEKLYFLMYEDEKEDLKLYSRKAYTRRIILEEILQKYKEINGGKHE